MKTALATLLLVLITLITVKEAVYIALFQVNQTFITENFCENKDITKDISENVCQGKCYVQKIIIENQQDNPQNQTIPTLKWEKTNLFVSSFIFKIIPRPILLPQPHGRLLADNQGIEGNIIAPPQF